MSFYPVLHPWPALRPGGEGEVPAAAAGGAMMIAVRAADLVSPGGEAAG